MAFEIYQFGKMPRGRDNLAKLDAKGRLYLSNKYPGIWQFELLWDEETRRIGIQPKEDGPRRFNVNKGGKIASVKSLLDEKKIPYPQICETEWQEEILVIMPKFKDTSVQGDEKCGE